jgi:hypothetical protein
MEDFSRRCELEAEELLDGVTPDQLRACEVEP